GSPACRSDSAARRNRPFRGGNRNDRPRFHAPVHLRSQPASRRGTRKTETADGAELKQALGLLRSALEEGFPLLTPKTQRLTPLSYAGTALIGAAGAGPWLGRVTSHNRTGLAM